MRTTTLVLVGNKTIVIVVAVKLRDCNLLAFPWSYNHTSQASIRCLFFLIVEVASSIAACLVSRLLSCYKLVILVGLTVAGIILGEDFRLSVLSRDNLLPLFRKGRLIIRLLHLHVLHWKRCVLWRRADYLVWRLYSRHGHDPTVLGSVLYIVKANESVTATISYYFRSKFHNLGTIRSRGRV